MISKRVNQLESISYNKGNYPGREEEINIGLTKINHMKKRFDSIFYNYNKKTH